MSTTLSSGMRSFNQRRATEVALQNEQITRQRVDHLERETMGHHHRLVGAEEILSRDFRGRLRWLLLGK